MIIKVAYLIASYLISVAVAYVAIFLYNRQIVKTNNEFDKPMSWPYMFFSVLILVSMAIKWIVESFGDMEFSKPGIKKTKETK